LELLPFFDRFEWKDKQNRWLSGSCRLPAPNNGNNFLITFDPSNAFYGYQGMSVFILQQFDLVSLK